MFNDLRKFMEMMETCSFVLTYPQIANYPNPDLKKRDEVNEMINPNYYVEPHICMYN